MMVALLLYAYARGTRSSRVIERACVEDVAFRVIAAQQGPDHATIARFVERHQEALAGVFGSVLGLCARAGWSGSGWSRSTAPRCTANASRDANVDYERIAREIVEEAIAIDRAEDELYGEARGDELPRELRRARAGGSGCARPSVRWMSERAERGAADPTRTPEAARGGQAPPGRAAVDGGAGPTRPTRPTARAGDERRQADRAGTTRSPTRRRSIRRGRSTRPIWTRGLVKGMRGWLQGYNAQAVTNEQQIVHRRRGDDVVTGLRAPGADVRRHPAAN